LATIRETEGLWRNDMPFLAMGVVAVGEEDEREGRRGSIVLRLGEGRRGLSVVLGNAGMSLLLMLPSLVELRRATVWWRDNVLLGVFCSPPVLGNVGGTSFLAPLDAMACFCHMSRSMVAS